mmetsp:Transcript_32428/g.29230  ORF Transcript_32428/g.29230 Transcript_32428/m.29230 type:complete len:92 (+) Transcript_32428:685-960(+)
MQKKALRRLNKKSYESHDDEMNNKGALYGFNPINARRDSSPERSSPEIKDQGANVFNSEDSPNQPRGFKSNEKAPFMYSERVRQSIKIRQR